MLFIISVRLQFLKSSMYSLFLNRGSERNVPINKNQQSEKRQNLIKKLQIFFCVKERFALRATEIYSSLCMSNAPASLLPPCNVVTTFVLSCHCEVPNVVIFLQHPIPIMAYCSVLTLYRFTCSIVQPDHVLTPLYSLFFVFNSQFLKTFEHATENKNSPQTYIIRQQSSA